MKRFLFFLFGFFVLSQGYSQDPELFKTWYLYSINLEGQQEPYDIWKIEPVIHPTLTITPDLQFSGVGACNTFYGQYSYQNGLLYVDSFTQTTNTCDFQSHTQFEGYYFSFFNVGADSQINYLTVNNLTIESPLFQSMQFSKYPLGISENKISDVKLYPNPASDELFISLEKDRIEKILIYSISGKKVLEVINIENSIDVSPLANGMYFVEIISSEGRSVEKFVKK